MQPQSVFVAAFVVVAVAAAEGTLPVTVAGFAGVSAEIEWHYCPQLMPDSGRARAVGQMVPPDFAGGMVQVHVVVGPPFGLVPVAVAASVVVFEVPEPGCTG